MSHFFLFLLLFLLVSGLLLGSGLGFGSGLILFLDVNRPSGLGGGFLVACGFSGSGGPVAFRLRLGYFSAAGFGRLFLR